MSKIRVLNVLPDERISGPAIRILQVATKLKVCGIETIVVMPEGDRSFAQDLDANDIRSFTLPLRRMKNTKNPLPNLVWCFSLLSSIPALVKIIRQESIDIVHCNGLVHITGGLAGRIAGIKVMWHLNDVFVPQPIQKVFKPIVQATSHLIVFASKAVQTHFGTISQGLPHGILYAPVDTQFFHEAAAIGVRPHLRQTFGIHPQQVVVGMVGNVNYLKGVLDFVQAAAIVHQKRPDVMFVHVGAKLSTKEHLYDEVETTIHRLGLTTHFILAGGRRNVRDFLAAMDIFVLPSISEACPIALLEAMAMEKPIVATNVGGVPELVRDGHEALLVPAHAPHAIAEKILFYLDHPSQSIEMARNARARAVDYFDIDRCVADHARYYRMLVH